MRGNFLCPGEKAKNWGNGREEGRRFLLVFRPSDVLVALCEIADVPILTAVSTSISPLAVLLLQSSSSSSPPLKLLTRQKRATPRFGRSSCRWISPARVWSWPPLSACSSRWDGAVWKSRRVQLMLSARLSGLESSPSFLDSWSGGREIARCFWHGS